MNMILLVKFAALIYSVGDFMHNMGKMYVVVAVVITVLAGLFLYLYNLDRKLSKIEKEIKR